MEVKDIQKAVQDEVQPILEKFEEIKSSSESVKKLEKTTKELEENINKLKEKTDVDVTKEVKESIETLKSDIKVVKDNADKNQDALDKLILERQKANGPTIPGKKESKSFNEILAEGIERNADKIREMPSLVSDKHVNEMRIDLMPEVKAVGNKQREVKVVGDMSISANFSGATALYQDVRPLIQSPYNRVWLADVIPNGTSNGTQLIYPKENGGEGAAAVWADPTADKAQLDFDLTSETVPFKWIAGWVIVAREMLDDIPFMTSYIQNKMLISLKTAENAFILNGDATSPAVNGLLDVATAYNGSYTADVDKLIDAGFGQIVEDTHEFYIGTTAVLRPRAAVAIGLNKATGSGEYDLPNGVGYTVGSRLNIGMELVTTTGITSGDFIVFDRSATMFIRRMVPELRIFEDSTLAKKNKIMFRIEERVTLAIFNNSAIVTGDLNAS